jgi:hypothetical protein
MIAGFFFPSSLVTPRCTGWLDITTTFFFPELQMVYCRMRRKKRRRTVITWDAGLLIQPKVLHVGREIRDCETT